MSAVGPVLASGGIADLLSQSFMQHAFLGGTAIALACGLVGYFVVLRGQVFGADALSHVALTGALAALAAGVDARLGLFAATVAVGIALGLLGRHGRADDVVIGVVFTWLLGLGVLFLGLATSSGSQSTAGVRVLFGSIFGLDGAAVWLAVAVSVGVVAALVVLARPLLFATVDEAVAMARGVPVRLLGVAFLGLVALCAAEATQAVGALLLVGLIAAPAGAAQRLTVRPWRAFALSGALAVLAMWAGLVFAYLVSDVPPSVAIVAVASSCYVLASGLAWLRRSGRARSSSRGAGTIQGADPVAP